MAPIPPTPDNNPALARYIAKRQAKACAIVPSSLPSNHTNRPSNRTTQIVNPKSRSRTPSKATNLEPGSCLLPRMDRPNDQPPPISCLYKHHYGKKLYKLLRKDNLTRHHYLAWTNDLFKAFLKQCKISQGELRQSFDEKDKTHTSHSSMDLPMELRYTILNLALQLNTEKPCRPCGSTYSEMVKPALLHSSLEPSLLNTFTGHQAFVATAALVNARDTLRRIDIHGEVLMTVHALQNILSQCRNVTQLHVANCSSIVPHIFLDTFLPSLDRHAEALKQHTAVLRDFIETVRQQTRNSTSDLRRVGR
ncbi:hypothetical protein D6D13_09441 [Aureobasidium pullulans]|uniref:Uncharacterized protein n=1 Tax=Aureobasidium pullulans TaxID=5580 RepID=A0A4S9C2E8_AURPU|nr:hypothetical protein D6D13_09441 [Aureobasidium pullulans]